jgi:hypothetical protein
VYEHRQEKAPFTLSIDGDTTCWSIVGRRAVACLKLGFDESCVEVVAERRQRLLVLSVQQPPDAESSGSLTIGRF